MNDSNNQAVNCKIVLLGNSGVGKTSLVNRWVLGTQNLPVKSTVGANHQRKRVTTGGEDVDVFIWDTAGQEQYQSLAPLYTRSSSAAIIVASLTDDESFNNLTMWAGLVKDSCEIVPPIILAVNKLDLNKNSQKVQEEIDSKYLDLFAGVFFTSAVSGEGVDQLFLQAAKSGLEFLKQNGRTKSILKPQGSDEKKTGNNQNGCC